MKLQKNIHSTGRLLLLGGAEDQERFGPEGQRGLASGNGAWWSGKIALCLPLVTALAGCGGLAEIDRKAANPELSESALATLAENVHQPVEVGLNPLALPDALRLSVLTSPVIEGAQFDFQIAGNAVQVERARFFPEIFYQISPPSSTNPDLLASAEAGLRYTIYDFGERTARVNAALWERQGASLTMIQFIDEVSVDTVQAYVGLAAAEASLLIANGLVVALGAERARVDARVTSGAANASELLSVNVAIMRAEADQIEARAHRGTVRVRLLTQTGVPLRAVESLDC